MFIEIDDDQIRIRENMEENEEDEIIDIKDEGEDTNDNSSIDDA